MDPPFLPNLVVLCRDENTTFNRNDPASVVGYINYVQNPYSTKFYTTTFTLKENQVAWLLKDGTLQFLVTTIDWAGANFYADYAGITACELVPSEALFSVPACDGRAPFAVAFTDQSLGNPTSWQWDFGDGATSSEQHPIHTYRAPGHYPVSLTVTGPGGANTKVVDNCIWVYDFVPSRKKYLAYISLSSSNSGILVLDCGQQRLIDKVGLPDKPWDVAATPDGKYLGLSFYATAAVRASTRNPEIYTIFDNLYGAMDIAVSPDCRFFYVAQGYSQSSTNISAVTRINNVDDTRTTIPLPDFPFPRTIDLNYNGTSMLMGCSTILAHVLNPASAAPEVNKVSTPIMSSLNFPVVVAPNGRCVYAAGDSPRIVAKIPFTDFGDYWKRPLKTIPLPLPPGPLDPWEPSNPWSLAVSPDNRWLYVVCGISYRESQLVVIDLQTDTVVKTVDVGSSPRCIAFSPDGRHAYVGSSGKINVLDVMTHEVINQIRIDGAAWAITIAPSLKKSAAFFNLLLN